eukprot:949467-Pyramimonas_sp.AAC.1
MTNQSGVLPGDHAATKLFVKAYGSGVQKMIDIMDTDPWQRALHTRLPCPLRAEHDLTVTDLATAVFVDDIARKIVGLNMPHFAEVAKWENRVIDHVMQEVGGAQNVEKQMNLVQGAGQPAGAVNRAFHERAQHMDGQVVAEA